jgi:hypothetical protein
MSMGRPWARPIRVAASRAFEREDLLRMLRLMGCPDPEGGLKAILAGGSARVASGKAAAWGLTLEALIRELRYEMRTGEGRRIDDPEFGEADARRMLTRMRKRKTPKEGSGDD